MQNKSTHILYLDDNLAMARLAQKRLVRAGYDVEIEQDGKMGLQKFKQGKFDVVAVDYHMPGYDGLDVIALLTSLDNFPPIIMVTGSGDEQVAVEAMKMGASDYVTKDVDGHYLDLLPAVIEQVLHKQLLQQERQHAINELKRRNHDLALLHETSLKLNATLNITQMVEQLLRAAVEIVGANAASFWLQESATSDRLLCKGIINHVVFHKSSDDLHLLSSQGLFEQVYASKKTRRVNDGDAQTQDLAPIGTAMGIEIHNVMAVPILSGVEVLGILIVANKDHESFTDNDLFLLETMAPTAATALENAKLFTEVERLSFTDDLTGVFSRRHFFALAEQEFQRSNRHGHDFAIVMLDIDHFKNVNDKYGHLVGDQVLKALARDLGKSLRGMDIISRYGGEEFIVLLPDTDKTTAIGVAERLREYVAEHVHESDQGDFTITISLGVVSFSKKNKNIEELLSLADKALYEAKVAGRNRVISA